MSIIAILIGFLWFLGAIIEIMFPNEIKEDSPFAIFLSYTFFGLIVIYYALKEGITIDIILYSSLGFLAIISLFIFILHKIFKRK